MDQARGSSLALLIMVVATSVAATLGFARAGGRGAIVAAVAGLLMACTGLVIARFGRARRVLDPGTSIPNLETLPPHQALAVLSAAASISTTEGRVPVFSQVLKALESIREGASRDPEEALRQVHILQREHPTNPAVTAELARLHRDVGRMSVAIAHASQAITLAVDGGMNPAAARIYADFEDVRDDLKLAPRIRDRLALILDNHGDSMGAAWCRVAPQPSMEEGGDSR